MTNEEAIQILQGEVYALRARIEKLEYRLSSEPHPQPTELGERLTPSSVGAVTMPAINVSGPGQTLAWSTAQWGETNWPYVANSQPVCRS